MHLSLRLILVVLGAAVLAWLAYLQYRGEERRPVVIGVLAALVAGGGLLEYRAQSAEMRLASAVSVLAHRDVGVRCQGILGNMVDIGPELGTVAFDAEGEPAKITRIKREACGWAKAYAAGSRRITQNNAVAVHVLAHEAMHLRGIPDEAVAECYSMQLAPVLAERLGATRMQAQQLAEFYWEAIYPDMPGDYTTSDCVDGGRLDLNKTSSVWPSPPPGAERDFRIN